MYLPLETLRIFFKINIFLLQLSDCEEFRKLRPKTYDIDPGVTRPDMDEFRNAIKFGIGKEWSSRLCL